MPVMTGPLSPYVTPESLMAAPTGISWQTIPDQRASDAEKYAAVVNMCQVATAMCDSRCNQILRSTIQTEQLFGPGSFRVNSLHSGVTRLLLSQWPITQVIAVQVANAARFPLQFTTVIPGSWLIERPALGLVGTSVAADSGTGGQAIHLGPGYVGGGRGSMVIETTYAAGWPHAGIAAAAAAGDGVLQVDDCTGWAPVTPAGQGATGVILDTAGNQEAVTATASSVSAGPGTLTLSAPLTYAHSPGVVISTLPNQVAWAATLYAVSQALTRGATATMIQTLAGTAGATASGAEVMQKQADMLLTPFMRVT